MYQQSIPVLPARNLRATLDFYETRLGFTGINLGNYAILKAGGAEIHFYLASPGEALHPVTCLLLAPNMEDLYTLFAGKDIMEPQGRIHEKSGGQKEFSIRDINGNIIRFRKAP